jgi:hypothetical protein
MHMSEQHDLRADEKALASPTETGPDSEQRADLAKPEESVGDAIGRFMREGPFIPHVFIAGGRMHRRIIGPVNPD